MMSNFVALYLYRKLLLPNMVMCCRNWANYKCKKINLIVQKDHIEIKGQVLCHLSDPKKLTEKGKKFKFSQKFLEVLGAVMSGLGTFVGVLLIQYHLLNTSADITWSQNVGTKWQHEPQVPQDCSACSVQCVTH